MTCSAQGHIRAGASTKIRARFGLLLVFALVLVLVLWLWFWLLPAKHSVAFLEGANALEPVAHQADLLS